MTPRRIFLVLMAIATAGLALYVLVEAIITDHPTQQVFSAILPLVLLFTVAWNGPSRKRD